jgi:catechol 2,3-dioxygenase
MAMTVDAAPGTAAAAAVRFPTRRLGHANIYVSDRDRAFAFYNGICGFDMVGHSKSSYFLSNGNSHHDFGLNGSGTNEPRYGTDGTVKSVANYRGPGTLNHLGWETANQAALVAAYRRALDADVRIVRSLYHGGSHALYLFDPDGVYHEFYADATLEWRKIFSGGDASSVTEGWDPLAKPADPTPYWDPNPVWVTVDKAPLQPRRLGRAVLQVSDVAKLVDFYRDVAGLDLMYLARDTSYAYLRGAARQSGFDLCLLKAEQANQIGAYRVAAELAGEDAVGRAEAALAGAGIAPSHSFDDARKRSFFLTDPDRVPIEFFVDRTPDCEALGAIAPAARVYAA